MRIKTVIVSQRTGHNKSFDEKDKPYFEVAFHQSQIDILEWLHRNTDVQEIVPLVHNNNTLLGVLVTIRVSKKDTLGLLKSKINTDTFADMKYKQIIGKKLKLRQID